jgi:hypothetical protein
MIRTRLALLACSLAALTAAPAAQPTKAVSAVPVVVELFTSEGCSSCPPADALLMDLVGSQPVRGALIIGLSEHVDYWDQLGWKDPFSTAGFTDRQSAYAAAAHSREIFTPQLIVDGSARLIGSDRSGALAAITKAAAVPKPPIRLAWAVRAPLTLEVSLDRSAAASNATLWLAITEDGLTSAVTRGENEGRQLRHSGVARRLTSIGQTDRDGAVHLSTPVSLDRSWNRAALHLVVFAQTRGDRRVVAAGALDIQ